MVLSIPEVKVNNYTRGVISVLCGIGDVRSRAVSLHGRSTGMTPGHIRLECGVRVNPIVSYCIPDVSCCVVCDVVVAAIADESGWCNILLIRFAM